MAAVFSALQKSMHANARFVMLALAVSLSFTKPANGSEGSPPRVYVSARILPGGVVQNTSELMSTCAPRIGMKTMDQLTYTESRWNAYAIGINYGKWRLKHPPRTKAEAVVTAKYLLDTYGKLKGFSIDVGAAQVNSNNLAKLGVTLEDLFDTCNNLRVAEIVLVDWCYKPAAQKLYRRSEHMLSYDEKQRVLAAALSCYNAGNFSRGIANGYAGKVYIAVPKRYSG